MKIVPDLSPAGLVMHTETHQVRGQPMRFHRWTSQLFTIDGVPCRWWSSGGCFSTYRQGEYPEPFKIQRAALLRKARAGKLKVHLYAIKPAPLKSINYAFPINSPDWDQPEAPP